MSQLDSRDAIGLRLRLSGILICLTSVHHLFIPCNSVQQAQPGQVSSPVHVAHAHTHSHQGAIYGLPV